MKIFQCVFENSSDWGVALSNRRNVSNQPAVYLICLEKNFPRLVGTTNILYIGHSGRFGGNSNRCRLYSYKYSNQRSGKITSDIEQLIVMGEKVILKWHTADSKEEAKRLEKKFLEIFLKEHMEYPPFNLKG